MMQLGVFFSLVCICYRNEKLNPPPELDSGQLFPESS